ncbi:hypothetical protein KC19_1G110000 [Ceratodon purpureus]|uniref:NB-ARC domain-containing protein n=1 Tax=Ceratodon purpureus TaxID=3225 RepID=A0A8T0J4U4_CERPU|nr:hypothetical protein KC19_1G110000 [Ceratodon purpureus]
MCKEIQDMIDLQQKDESLGVCVMGLYGMVGIGKTSICKALCNEFYTKFHGKVCHAELERVVEDELLREVLKKLSNTNHEQLDEFNENELHNGLIEGIIKEPVFLALDNMSDTDASIMQAKSYLSARLPHGSIVMVTARAKDSLIRVRPYLSEKNCMSMPELMIEEAKALFVQSSNFEQRSDHDEQLIERCVKRCRFSKDDTHKSYHYHPLALNVLGRQLGFIDPKDWEEQLDKIDEDIFNSSKETKHPIFSILRKSFDALSPEDQMLFIDVALFLPEIEGSTDVLCQWLGMVHGIHRVDNVMMALKRLKRKSLLEHLGDGNKTRIGIHDLWRAFCVAETKSGKLKRQRWVYEVKVDKCSDLVETSPSGSCWENVKRMAFIQCELRRLRKVNFAHFPNVTVLRISHLRMADNHVLDLSAFIHLKSLEVLWTDMNKLVLKGLPRGLIFLSFMTDAFQVPDLLEFVKQIECLKELQRLELYGYEGDKLPDMRSMDSLRVAIFSICKNVVTLTGLSSHLENLRVLKLGWCDQLRSCPGVGDLVLLEELIFQGCGSLEKLPNLRKLKKLRKLDVSECLSITELPGLDDLVALEELHANECLQLSLLPDLHKLTKLQVFNVRDCPLKSASGFDSLISLKQVDADFREVVDKPVLRQVTKLQQLEISGWSSEGLRGLCNLTMLHRLQITSCYSGVNKLPDLQCWIRLQTLTIGNCEFEDMSGLSNLSTLNSLQIYRCEKLERLPDFQRLTGLESLGIWGCPMLRCWDCKWGQVEESSCMSDDAGYQFDVPNCQVATNLRTLTLRDCGLEDLTGIGAFSEIQELHIEFLAVQELPDLINFPQLNTLSLGICESLRGLTSCKPMNALLKLQLYDCRSLETLPDLSKFPRLLNLNLCRCGRLTSLSSSGALPALQGLEISVCSGLKELPDLGMLPALKNINVERMSGLVALSSSGPLPALQQLNLEDCSGLKELSDLGMFPALKKLSLDRVNGLTALSCSVPLTKLERIYVRECRGLSEDDFDQLQKLAGPQCELQFIPYEELSCEPVQQVTLELMPRQSAHYEDVQRRKSWLSRTLGCCRAC